MTVTPRCWQAEFVLDSLIRVSLDFVLHIFFCALFWYMSNNSVRELNDWDDCFDVQSKNKNNSTSRCNTGITNNSQSKIQLLDRYLPLPRYYLTSFHCWACVLKHQIQKTSLYSKSNNVIQNKGCNSIIQSSFLPAGIPNRPAIPSATCFCHRLSLIPSTICLGLQDAAVLATRFLVERSLRRLFTNLVDSTEIHSTIKLIYSPTSLYRLALNIFSVFHTFATVNI